jgi:nucleoside triphosphate pyrophosphatase
MIRLILASASSGRRRVLQQAGIDPVVLVSGVDEDAVIAALPDDTALPDVVCALATAKANDVHSRLSAEMADDCVVIGCDSMLELDGRLRGKPGTVAAARRQWEAMAGRVGVLHTGHAVHRLHRGDIRREAETGSTTVHFARPSAEELQAYLATDEPLAVAGSFTLDGYGGWFVDRIEGDPSNVIGLSLPLMRRLLARLDLSVSTFWQ